MNDFILSEFLFKVHCYDEYSAYIDKDGVVSDQKARVRLFCLAFVTGKPFLEIGLNDRTRQGKVRYKQSSLRHSTTKRLKKKSFRWCN